MDKGVVKVEVDVMVVELEDSSRILDLKAPVEDVLLLEERGEGGFCDEGGVGVNADVVGDVGCTPTKVCSDVVALAPSTVGMVFFSWQEVETYYKAYARCVTDSQIEEDSSVKTSKKCECPVHIYASVNAENENEWVVRKVVNEHQKHNPTLSKSRFIAAHRKEEMNCRVKRKLKDIRNEFYREKKLKLKDGDAKAMLEYFEKMTEGNHIFFHTYRLDNFGQMGIAPGGILTDQAVAMRNALRSTMPETRHHWCIWHMTEKFSQKLGKCKGYNEFKDELLNPIYDSLFVPEFESSWMAVINKHALEDNVWLDGMKTTQRVVSIHSICDDYVNKHTTLAELKEMYCRAMEKRVKTESNMILIGVCRNKEMKNEYLTQYKRNYRVHFDMSTKLAECECSLFNHSGIICRHMIKLYDILCEEVPDRYIQRRWRKDVSRKHTCVKVAYYDPSKTVHVVSYDEMQLAFEPIFSKASVFMDTQQLVLEFLKLLDIRVYEKRVMIESEMLNQTPSSVCLKDKQVGTPASTTTKRKADCGIPTTESYKLPSSARNEGNVKDPPRKAKPACRTTDDRHYLVVKKAIKAKPKQKTKVTVSKGTLHLTDVNQGAIVPTSNSRWPAQYRCSNGVPMVDPDGSLGLFNLAGCTQRVLFPDNQASTNGKEKKGNKLKGEIVGENSTLTTDVTYLASLPSTVEFVAMSLLASHMIMNPPSNQKVPKYAPSVPSPVKRELDVRHGSHCVEDVYLVGVLD
ncbi:Protein FAR1-RELATED SEQUENCE 1 [Bienertia sinuspersici]